VVQQRANRLSAAAKRALTLAAVAGRRFDFGLLARALGCDEDDLLPLVKEFVAAQLVTEESADRFAFRHALVRQAIYGEMLARERRALHRTIADALEARHATPARRDAHLADLAYHCYEAGDWERARGYKQRAGERALALHAPGAAIEHLTHALEAAQQLQVAPSAAVYYARGQAYAARGEFDRARDDYERALEGAESAADGALAWQGTMALGFLWAGRDYAQAGAWFRRASELAARLADPLLRARSLNRLGNWLSNTGRIEEGLRAHHEALAIFEEWDDRQGMAETFDLLGTTYGIRGDKISAVHYLGRAIPLFRALVDTPGLISSLAMRTNQGLPWSSETTFSPLGSQETWARDATEALQLARQIEAPAAQAFAGNALANALLARGEFGPSLARAYEARRIATEIGHRQWMVATAFVLGRTYLLLHAPAQAISTLEVALSLARDLGSMFWIASVAASLGRAQMVNGDLAAAEAVLMAIMPREQQPRNTAERGVALAWGELALAQGEADVALRIAEQLLASAADSAPDQPAQPIPLVLKLRGEALLALARPIEALAALEDAGRGALERGSRPDLWAIQCSLGRAYQILKRDDDARRVFTAARQLAEEMAATVDDAALREQFQRAVLAALPREKPLSPREAARRAYGGLTARECEVAALIVQGKTSREIAETLVITERTAEVHVGNILGKLGFSSRAQIAAWAVERGLGKG
jgi:DNA-binding CsgD family transcriptional regulator